MLNHTTFAAEFIAGVHVSLTKVDEAFIWVIVSATKGEHTGFFVYN